MKCYQVIADDVIPGLPIVYGQERPHVKIGHLRAYLSDELLESNPGPRLLDAEATAVRGDCGVSRYCLSSATHKSQSVLVLYQHRSGLIEALSKVVGPTWTTSDSAVVLQTRNTIYDLPFGSRTVSECTLAILAQDSRIDLQQSWTTLLPRAPGFFGFFAPRRTQPQTRDVPFLKMNAGRPVLTPA